MSISNVGQRFIATSPQSGKNIPHPAVDKTNDVTAVKTKPPGTADTESDKTNKRLQALQEGLKQLESMPSSRRATKQTKLSQSSRILATAFRSIEDAVASHLPGAGKIACTGT